MKINPYLFKLPWIGLFAFRWFTLLMNRRTRHLFTVCLLVGTAGCFNDRESATSAEPEPGEAGAETNAPLGETRTITPPDVQQARGGFTDLPPFDAESRPSRCVKPLLIGHRGSRFKAPENTIPSFVQAMEVGGDGVEIDVRSTADGVPVAFHDSRTQSTTDDQTDRAVSEVSLEELKALDAGSWFAPQWAGTRVPTVEEAADALPEDAILVFDVRSGAAETLASLIDARGWSKRSVVASNRRDVLQTLRDSLPDVQVAFFASDTSQLEVADEVSARYVRVPIDKQHLEHEHWALIDAGYEPIVSSTYLTWNVGMVFVNNMENGVERRNERKPAECD